jgi:hypothetical protein
MAFQEKCMDKMNELRDSGATIIFISHNLPNVTSFCKRVILLRNGQISAEGDPKTVVESYKQQEREQMLLKLERLKAGIESASSSGPEAGSQPTKPVIIKEIEIMNMGGHASSEFEIGDRVLVRCHFHASKLIREAGFVVRIRRADGLMCSIISSPRDTKRSINGDGIFEACIGPLFLQPDFYSIQTLIFDREYGSLQGGLSNDHFQIIGDTPGGERGVIAPEVDWHDVSGIQLS